MLCNQIIHCKMNVTGYIEILCMLFDKGCMWHKDMIKIISYVDIAFFYWQANILRRWSNILQRSYGNKGQCHGSRSHWFWWQHALLHVTFEQLQKEKTCNIKISVVSHCSILVTVQYVNTQMFAFFYQVATCTCWTAQWLGLCWCWLSGIDADLTCWLAADALVWKHKTQIWNWHKTQIWNWLRQLPHHTQVVRCLQTVHCRVPLLMHQRWQNRCRLSFHLMTMQKHTMLPTRFLSNCPMRTTLPFRCRQPRLYL